MREELVNKLTTVFGKTYAEALVFTMSAEGLFSNHVDDTGGMTYKGVARVYNERWEGWRIIDKYLEDFPELAHPYNKKPTSISQLNTILEGNIDLDVLVYDFYFNRYFTKVGADKVPEKVAIVLFDISVLQGVKRGVKTIQRLVNRYFGGELLVDGIFGSKTAKAIQKAIDLTGYERFVAELILEYQDNLVEASKYKNNYKFLSGWMKRITNLRNYLRLIP